MAIYSLKITINSFPKALGGYYYAIVDVLFSTFEKWWVYCVVRTRDF